MTTATECSLLSVNSRRAEYSKNVVEAAYLPLRCQEIYSNISYTVCSKQYCGVQYVATYGETEHLAFSYSGEQSVFHG